MPIKYGKGIKGALGKLGMLGDTYVPLPFKEMLIGNQMKQASYDKSEATLDEISALYDENFIAKDSEILEGQENQLNAGIEEMIESAGGDLGKLTGKFTNLYRKTASDKTYRNAKAQHANRAAFAEELRKAKLDPGMAQYYLNQADEMYPGADKGQYSGVNYSTVKQKDIRKELLEQASKIGTADYTTTLHGYMYKGEFYEDKVLLEAGIDGEAMGLTKASRDDVSKTRNPQDVYNLLNASIEGNLEWGQAIRDYTNAHGIDIEDYISNLAATPANLRFEGDYKEGKPYAPLGTDTNSSVNKDLFVPGTPINVSPENILKGKDETGTPTASMHFADKVYNLETSRTKRTISDSEYYADKSILNMAKAEAEKILGYKITKEDLDALHSTTAWNEMKYIRMGSGPGNKGMILVPSDDTPAGKRHREINNALGEGLETVTSRSTYTPVFQTVTNMDKPETEVLAEFKSVIAMSPESFMMIDSVNRGDGEGIQEPNDNELNGKTIKESTITQVSDRPLYNHETGALEYKVVGTYKTKAKNRSIDDSEYTEGTFNASIPVSDVQQQLWARLGLNPLTTTKAELARLNVTGQATTSDSLLEISKSRSASKGSPVMYGVVLDQDRSGEDTYSIVELDAKGGSPKRGEDGEYIRFTTPDGSAIFSTLEGVSRYIDLVHSKIR